MRYDHRLHFIAGSIAYSFGAICDGVVLGLLMAILAGSGKEVWDHFHDGDVSLDDTANTILGGCATALLTQFTLLLIEKLY